MCIVFISVDIDENYFNKLQVSVSMIMEVQNELKIIEKDLLLIILFKLRDCCVFFQSSLTFPRAAVWMSNYFKLIQAKIQPTPINSHWDFFFLQS